MFIPCPYCGKIFHQDQIDEHRSQCDEDPIDPPPMAFMTPNRARWLMSNPSEMTIDERKFVCMIWEMMPGGLPFSNALNIIAQDQAKILINRFGNVKEKS